MACLAGPLFKPDAQAAINRLALYATSYAGLIAAVRAAHRGPGRRSV